MSPRLASLMLVAALAPVAHVARAEAGVHVDPNSPAGKEYVLPLDSARHTGGGAGATGHSGSGSSHATPLFGSGIKRRPPSAGVPAVGTSRQGSSVKHARRPARAKARPTTPPGHTSSGSSSAPRLHAIETAAHSSTGAQPTVLIVVAILLGGVVLGGALRLRQRPA